MNLKSKIFNKIGAYNSDKNTCYVNLEKAKNKDGNIDLSYLERYASSTTFVIEGEHIFEKDDKLSLLYINIPGNIIFRNCNFDRVHPQIESIGSVSFIDCKFVMSQVDVRSVKNEITNCVSSNTNFDIDSDIAYFNNCNFNGEKADINIDNYNHDYYYPYHGKTIIKDCNFDIDEFKVDSSYMTHIEDNTNITANKLKITSFNGCINNSDIVAMRFYTENNEQLLINNGIICAEHSTIYGDEVDIRNSNINIDNFEINNNSTILYNSNLVGKYIVINSSDNFKIDKDSEVRCHHTFFEIPEVPNCKLYPNSIKADRVSLNGALVNKDSNEFADITLIEPRNNLINLLKNLRNKYNEKMDFVSREINHEINGITVKEIETLKSDEEKILKRVKMNLNKNK